jgi:hypothetical protein
LSRLCIVTVYTERKKGLQYLTSDSFMERAKTTAAAAAAIAAAAPTPTCSDAADAAANTL